MIVPFYAAVLGFLFVWLSLQTIRVRGRLKIAVGDGGNPEMARAMRVHANFSEYVPMSLMLIYFVQLSGAAGILIHVLCGSLLIGRSLHAFGVSKVQENFRFRISGMVLTFSVILVSSLYLLVRVMI